MCVRRTAEYVVLTLCPPGPLEQNVSIRRSFSLIWMSTSSASGSTATVAVDVWIRPLASVAGTLGGFGQASYSTTKSGILGLTKTLAMEGGRHGITCNAIVPGIIGTEAFHMAKAAMNERIASRTVFKRPGDPQDIDRTDARVKELIPDDPHLHRWLNLARERIKYQGLPARICWVGLGQRHRLGLAFNEMVASGELKAPIVIGRDHLDSGSVASPNRETEAMQDGSDAVADWPMLNALLNTASGATWVSIHNGGGVGIGYSTHAGQVIVADGTPAAAKRLERVLTSDPGMGVVRHADAGYPEAIAAAKRHGIKMPMLGPAD